ncbi:MAG: hypothetical protein DCF15_08315 [Phormidesmis priestleyi]|uniref:Uncharacterized protein n=1 Tax=Phormidesmis priestleyi TaxID=268141 RepID=A0A2W4XGZ5_9CYAN|nr:MAG: hypothetical protein DCF15_08315 [Phormidesmis priestleyi]
MTKRSFVRVATLTSVLMLALAVITGSLPLAAQAQLCTYRCGSNQIRFEPAQPITIKFINHTNNLITLERVLDIDKYWLRPQSEYAIQTLVGADRDMSMVFWNDQNRAISAVLHRPDAATLLIEFLPSAADSDRAVHIVNDGRVLVY